MNEYIVWLVNHPPVLVKADSVHILSNGGCEFLIRHPIDEFCCSGWMEVSHFSKDSYIGYGIIGHVTVTENINANPDR